MCLKTHFYFVLWYNRRVEKSDDMELGDLIRIYEDFKEKVEKLWRSL